MPQKPDLFRITVDEPNFSALVRDGVSEERREALPPELKELGDAGVWGFKRGKHNERLYTKFLAPGDTLLFYMGKRGLPNPEQRTEGEYVGVGTVGGKVEISAEAADAVFGNPNAQLAFTVEDFQPARKTIDEMERILGYKSHPQGPLRVKEDRYDSVEAVKRAVLQ